MSTYTEEFDSETKLNQRREYMKKYMKEHRFGSPEKTKENERRYKQNLKKRAMEHLGGAVCVECGCDVYAILEINHICGGGRKEMKELYGRYNQPQFLRDILSGKLVKDKYNVLCKVCNIKHHVKNNLGISGHTVKWSKG